MRISSLFLTVLALFLPVATARAAEESPVAAEAPAPIPHELGQSYLYLRVYADSLTVRLEITVEDMNRVLGTTWDPETLTSSEVRDVVDQIREYAEPRFELASGGNVLPAQFQLVDLVDLGLAHYVTLTYAIDVGGTTPDELDVEFTALFEVDRDHRNMLVIEHNWRTSTFNNEANVSLIFSPRSPRQSLDLSASTVLRGFIGFIWLGVWHILIGLDHILFLLALALPAVLVRREGSWEPVPDFRTGLMRIVTIVTFFTIAHSITLSLAALDMVRLPSRFVESIIAASIAAAALANLAPRLDVREWAIAFVFGLFHGFGFASVLGDIGMGQEYLVLSLLGFNIGVEIGQLGIICLAFGPLFALRRSPAYKWILRVGSSALIAIALYWFLERSLDTDIPLVPAPLRGLVDSLLGA